MIGMLKSSKRQVFSLLFAMLLSPVALAQSSESITLHYSERKPYQYTDENGLPAGMLVAPTKKAFARAGIPVEWISAPFNRNLMAIQANDGNDCSIGWYKTPEREKFAQFTLPLHLDQPQIGIVRAGFNVPEGVTAKQMLGNPETRLLLKQSFVYGAYLDNLISQMPVQNVQRVSVEIPNLLLMLLAYRANLVLISNEEAEYYAGQPDFPMSEFQIVRFPDALPGEPRYLMCSKWVSPALMERLNQAIREEVAL